MTLLPQLERELVDATARYYAPRRVKTVALVKRRAARAAFGLSLIAAVVSLLWVAVGAWSPTETEVGPSQPGRVEEALPLLSDAFEAFRRPRTPRDSVPVLDERVIRVIEQPGVALQLQDSRLVASNSDSRYYAVPANGRNGPNLCILDVERDGGAAGAGAGGGCGALDGPISSARPSISTTTRPGSRQEIFALFRDGVDHAELELRDGRRITARVAGNALLVTVDPGVKSMSWTDEHGTRHDRSFYDDPADPGD